MVRNEVENMLKNLNDEEKEFFAKELMNNLFGVFSPFELDENADFPEKDELGGVVLKFIGGGAAYLKIQTEMPTEDEVESIHDVGRFLRDSFGEYVIISVLCTPDIEIHDINLDDFTDMQVDFASARKSKGDLALEILCEKLRNNEKFTEKDYYYMFLLPFMGREDNEEFEIKYSKFLESLKSTDLELPTECNLNLYNVWDRIFEK